MDSGSALGNSQPHPNTDADALQMRQSISNAASLNLNAARSPAEEMDQSYPDMVGDPRQRPGAGMSGISRGGRPEILRENFAAALQLLEQRHGARVRQTVHEHAWVLDDERMQREVQDAAHEFGMAMIPVINSFLYPQEQIEVTDPSIVPYAGDLGVPEVVGEGGRAVTVPEDSAVDVDVPAARKISEMRNDGSETLTTDQLDILDET